MGEPKFTPGPWKLFQAGRDFIVTQQDGDGFIETVYGREDKQEECAANAHLIAEAPELYKIGQHLLDIFDHPTDSVTILDADRLRDILARARGES